MGTFREQSLRIDGHRTIYLDNAAGHRVRPQGTIVLAPSMFLLARSYRTTMESLAREGFRVVVIELPGTGRSRRSAVAWSFDDYAFWLMSATEAIGLDRPALVGHSVSAPVVLTAAVRHASRTGPIVICDSVGAREAADSMWRILPRRCIDAVEELAFDLRATPDALYNAARHPRDCLHQLRLAKVSQVNMARRVRAPALLAWGGRDRTMPVRWARALAQTMSDATMYVSRQGSHDWIIDRADEFAGAVRQFVAAINGPPTYPIGNAASGDAGPYRSTGTAG